MSFPLLHAGPAAGFDQPFELLEACHARMERSLALLERLGEHLATQGVDAQAREAAAWLSAEFPEHARAHRQRWMAGADQYLRS